MDLGNAFSEPVLGAQPLATRSATMTSTPLSDAGRFLVRLPALVLIGLVRFYQKGISPFTPAMCRFTPTCSQYAVLALQRYGFVRGTLLAGWRILRCNPFGGRGYDPPRWFTERLPEHPPTCSCETEPIRQPDSV